MNQDPLQTEPRNGDHSSHAGSLNGNSAAPSVKVNGSLPTAQTLSSLSPTHLPLQQSPAIAVSPSMDSSTATSIEHNKETLEAAEKGDVEAIKKLLFEGVKLRINDFYDAN